MFPHFFAMFPGDLPRCMPGKKALEGILRSGQDGTNNIQNISAAHIHQYSICPQLPWCALVTIASVFPGCLLCYESPLSAVGRRKAE